MSRNMSHHMSSGRGVGRVSKFAAAAVVAGALAASTPAALAHDAVIGGSPADKEVVTAFPITLELESVSYTHLTLPTTF